MATAPYITADDIPNYLKDVSNPPNQAIFQYFAGVISDFLEEALGQYFFSDVYETKWFDGGDYDQQGNIIDFGMHPCYGKVGNIAAASAGSTSLRWTPYRSPVPNNGDLMTLGTATNQEVVTITGAPTDNGDGTYQLTTTAGTRFQHPANEAGTNINVQLAYFENQPTAQWILNISGDGIRPPSNYFMWPRNPRPYQSSDPFARKPWSGVDLSHIPMAATSYLPTPIPGYLTIAIAANWGWPSIPLSIKNFVGMTTVKMWRARGTAWSERLGGKEVGEVKAILAEIGALEEFILLASSYKKTRL